MAHLKQTPAVFAQHCWSSGLETELQQYGRHFPCQEQGVTSIVSAHAWICPDLQGWYAFSFLLQEFCTSLTYNDTSRPLSRVCPSKFSFETAFYSSRGTKILPQIKVLDTFTLLLRSQLRGEKPPNKLKSLYRNNGNPLLGISRSTCNNVTFTELLLPPIPFFFFLPKCRQVLCVTF